MPISTFLHGRPPGTLRGLTWLSLSDLAVIQTRTAASDSGGGASWTWAAAGTVPCRVAPVGGGGSSREVGGRIDERSTHSCTMPAGAAVDLQSRIAVQGRGTFEVTAVRVRTDALTSVVEVIEIDP